MQLRLIRGFFLLLVGVISSTVISLAQATTYYPNGFFAQAGVVPTSLQVSNLDFKSHGGSQSPLDRDIKNFKDFSTGFLAGIGFQIKYIPLAFSIDYTKRGTISASKYNAIPNATDPESLDISVQNATELFNLIYDPEIWNVNYIVPIFIAGAGMSQNKTSVDSTYLFAPYSVAKSSKTTSGLAWDAGAGVRVKLTNNLFINAYYRYVYLGKIDSGDWKNSQATGYTSRNLKTSDFTSNEGIVSFAYYLGGETPPKAPPSLLDD